MKSYQLKAKVRNVKIGLTSSFEAPLATSAVVAISAAIIAGSISSPRPTK